MDGYEPQATFNMATATLIRMDTILRLITFASLKKDYNLWRDCLFDMNRQLSGFINDKEAEELDKKFEDAFSDKWSITDKKGSKKINPNKVNDIYLTLHNMTKDIIRIMGDKGLLMKKSDDPRRAVVSN